MSAAKIWFDEIDWFFHHLGSALGERSNLSSVIVQLERGGPGTSSDTPEWNFDEASVRRAGNLLSYWRGLESRHQRILEAHYCGAMRREIRRKTGESKWAKWPHGVEGQLQDPPGVAIMLAHEAGKLGELLNACANPKGAGHREIITHWERLAVAQQVDAHDAWRDAKRRLSPAAQRARQEMGS